MKPFILGLLLTYSTSANAEEPIFVPLKEGEAAPFDGRLFNSAAVSKFIIENKMKVEQCNVQIDYEVGKANAKSKYKFDLHSAKCEADDQRFQDLISIRDDEIKFLRKAYNPPKYHWWAVAGFTFGSVATVGIMYSIAPGLR
jgi:hypothetical protein